MTKAKKSKIPYLFFLFFGVIFAVDATFVYLSKQTWRGVAVENAYEKGLRYNEVIAQYKRQDELGWKMAVSFRNSGYKEGDLLIHFQDENITPIRDAKITVYFKRPTQSGYDFEQEMTFENNAYVAHVKFPLVGQWQFEIKAMRGDEQFVQSKRYVVKWPL